MKEIEKAIKDIEWMKKIHDKWASHFESNPDIEKEYVATGEWNTAKEHREIMGMYDNVLDILKSLIAEREDGR